jgi:NADPH-dependent 2,4-dienoyl-CoA reductase/sulfur reductase-like enzyme
MRSETVDVAIVGGGPAGAAAAEMLGAHGVRVLILDDHSHPGGQYLRGGPAAGPLPADAARRRSQKLMDRLERIPVDIRRRTEVLGIEPGPVLLASDAGGKLFTVKAACLLLATGARERFIPFKGWTLPGVLATGAAQILIKQSGILPARETLVAGAGLFPTAVAGDILKSGGRVPAVLDEMPLSLKIPPARIAAGHFPTLFQGAAIMGRLLFSGTTLRSCTRIVEARGGGRLREVVAARVDRRGAVVAGSEEVFPVECLAVGFGFSPNIELAQLAGCDLAHNAGLGGWVVKVDEDLETSVAGVFAAGEITAVGGAAKSLTEGRLAGLAILGRLGRRAPAEAAPEAVRLKTTRRRQLAFARWFNAQHYVSPDRLKAVYSGLADEVPVCRCEDVGIGALRRAVEEGLSTPAGVKKATRCGMGICQGSTCKAILLDALTVLTGRPPTHFPPPSVRMPVKPVYLGTLAGESGGDENKARR